MEDSQVGRREVFACQMYTVVGSEADEERRNALWDILKKVLLFSTTALGCSLLLREIGTSNPMQTEPLHCNARCLQKGAQLLGLHRGPVLRTEQSLRLALL